MSDELKPAKILAEKMDKPAIGASAAYLSARTALLAGEIELRRHMERVAAQRRALPPGPVVKENYVFEGGKDGKPARIRFSELFRDGSDSLLIYCYMFPRHSADLRVPARTGETAKLPVKEQPCPSCTGLLDQLDAAALHFHGNGGSFVVLANTSLDNLLAVARDRDWKHLRLLSSSGTSFKRDYHAEDSEGQQLPGDARLHARSGRQHSPVLGVRVDMDRHGCRPGSSRGRHHRAVLEHVRPAAERPPPLRRADAI